MIEILRQTPHKMVEEWQMMSEYYDSITDGSMYNNNANFDKKILPTLWNHAPFSYLKYMITILGYIFFYIFFGVYNERPCCRGALAYQTMENKRKSLPSSPMMNGSPTSPTLSKGNLGSVNVDINLLLTCRRNIPSPVDAVHELTMPSVKV